MKLSWHCHSHIEVKLVSPHWSYRIVQNTLKDREFSTLMATLKVFKVGMWSFSHSRNRRLIYPCPTNYVQVTLYGNIHDYNDHQLSFTLYTKHSCSEHKSVQTLIYYIHKYKNVQCMYTNFRNGTLHLCLNSPWVPSKWPWRKQSLPPF